MSSAGEQGLPIGGSCAVSPTKMILFPCLLLQWVIRSLRRLFVSKSRSLSPIIDASSTMYSVWVFLFCFSLRFMFPSLSAEA